MLRRLLPLLLLGGLTTPAAADTARLQSLGDVDLLIEDSTNVFTNPALMTRYSNRAWFSLGVAVPNGGGVQLSPLGGAAVRIKDFVTLGVVLNRSPQLYGFDRAIWPVLTTYLPQGPGGPIEGPDGPSEDSAPLVFPLDAFVAIGSPYGPARVGFNVYYAGGNQRDWAIDDSDQDNLEDSDVVRRQTHLLGVSVGVSGGTPADRVRPEGWLRFGYASAWHDQVADTQTDADTEPVVDRILAMDRDLRVGGGVRVHIGDQEQGLLLTPGLQYDAAGGAFRFDDNLVSPDGPAEVAERASQAHDVQAGVGLTWRGDDLLVVGTASLRMRLLEQVDTLPDTEGEAEVLRDLTVDLTVPELSVGAEYRVVGPLLVRAGIRSTVVGGRRIGTVKRAEGDEEDPFETEVVQSITPLAPGLSLSATGGIGLQVKRFSLDALVGSLFLRDGAAAPNLFTRLDLAFSFD